MQPAIPTPVISSRTLERLAICAGLDNKTVTEVTIWACRNLANMEDFAFHSDDAAVNYLCDVLDIEDKSWEWSKPECIVAVVSIGAAVGVALTSITASMFTYYADEDDDLQNRRNSGLFNMLNTIFSGGIAIGIGLYTKMHFFDATLTKKKTLLKLMIPELKKDTQTFKNIVSGQVYINSDLVIINQSHDVNSQWV